MVLWMGVLGELIWLGYHTHVMLHRVLLLVVRQALREGLLLRVHLHLPIKMIMWRHVLSWHLLGLHGQMRLYLRHLLLRRSEGVWK